MNKGINPWFLAYSPPNVGGELDGVLAVAKPGAIIVTGRGNRYHPTFQKARQLGAKVYTYWNVANAPLDLKNPEDAAQYLIDGKAPPAWPHKTKTGQNRSQWRGTYLLDLRPGSAWLKHIVPLCKRVAEEGKFDGFFLDTLGARCWNSTKTVNGKVIPGADWGTWPVSEQNAWAEGSLNIAKEIAAAVPAGFELVHNNIWDLPKGHPLDSSIGEGDRYCNGVCMENPSGDTPSQFHMNYAGHIFGRMPRRMLIIESTDVDAKLWAAVPGVTHVASVEKAKQETYAEVTPPVVPYSGWGDTTTPPPPPTEDIAVLRRQIAELTAQRDDARRLLDSANKQNAALNATLDQVHKLTERVV